jgi:AcrR family transcriptional regulator
MRLFWAHGYEGVSINDLTAAIGIAPPSLYAAFGSKADLYREALDRYASLPSALDGLMRAGSLDEAVSLLLASAIQATTDPQRERGCMVSTGLLACAARHADLASDLRKRRRSIRESIAQGLSRWLDADAADTLSGHLAVVLQGLSIQAQDGASPEDLHRIAEEVAAAIRARRQVQRA